MDLETAADQLYALAPAEFTARRTELAAQARQAGLSDVAKEIAELRRPTVSAGLINQLIRAEQVDAEQDDAGRDDAGRPVEQLRSLGVRLRDAQAKLDGGLLRELTRQRHELVAVLVRRAAELAADSGQKVSGSVQRELEETFGAAAADEQASLAVTSGRLTRALVYAGFGDVDVTAATATPLTRTPRPLPNASRRIPGPAPKGRPPEDARAQAEAAKVQAAAEAARTAVTMAEGELATAAQHLETTVARETELSNRLDELQHEILQLRHELDAVSRKATAADRDHQRQQRQVRDARKAAEQAEQALARLGRDT